MSSLRLIVACDQKQGIAKNGAIPWDLPTERQHFAQLTQQCGGNVLMGRATYETIGHPLAGRQNYVLSQTRFTLPGTTVITDLDSFLNSFEEDIWVIGGAEIYTATLSRATELYVTEIGADYDCDTFFPAYAANFTQQSVSESVSENGVPFRYCIYIPNSI